MRETRPAPFLKLTSVTGLKLSSAMSFAMDQKTTRRGLFHELHRLRETRVRQGPARLRRREEKGAPSRRLLDAGTASCRRRLLRCP